MPFALKLELRDLELHGHAEGIVKLQHHAFELQVHAQVGTQNEISHLGMACACPFKSFCKNLQIKLKAVHEN